MFKKFTCLTIIFLVLGLVGNIYADLVVHWALEEGSGTVATDFSGNGNEGTLNGDPEWVEGRLGGGLHFGGDAEEDFVVYSLPGGATVWEAGTIAVWVKADSLGQDTWSGCFTNHNPNTAGIQFDVDGGNPGNYRLNPGGQFFGPVTTDWVHLALSFEDGSGTFYYNGEEATTAGLDDSQRTFNEFALGLNRNHTNWMAATIDELRVYDHPLSAEDIQTIMVTAARRLPRARRPDPEDGALLEQTWVSLTWAAGDGAVSHDLHFGTNFDDVNTGAENTFVGNLATATQVVGFPGFPAPDGLQPGTTYYWRVDEVNDADPNSPWIGDVWSFTVPPKTAYNADPPDGMKFIDPNVELGWTAGFGAKLHSVYFGDDFDEVSNASGAVPQADPMFTPGPLELEKTYYWRIDEFDGTETHKGDVWSFSTIPVIPLTEDPNLVAMWSLDEGIGTTALDMSGRGYHGTLFGPEWSASARLGDASLDLNNGYVAIQDLSYAETGLTEVTVTAWVRTSSDSGQFVISFDRNEYWRLAVGGTGPDVDEGQVGWHVMTDTGQIDYGSVTRVDDGRWHHITGVFDNGTLIIYIDGVAEPSTTGGPTYGTGNSRFGFIGANSEAGSFNSPTPGGNPLDGLVDDIRIYSKALTAEEIQLVMRGDPKLAWKPSPADETMPDVDNVLPLTWSAGDEATSHEVYFGTDMNSVANADTSDTTGIYRGRQNSRSFIPAENLEWGSGPYYWRIDENNADGTVTKGRVWTFTVADFLLVDDFESYTDNDAEDEAIWQTWVDGFGVPTNGSQVGYVLPPYAEQTIVHGGFQSMPLLYDNTAGVRNSEVVLPLTAPRDWTAHDVEILSLWYRGFPPSDGSFVQGPGNTFTMTASGSDIWNTSDEFHFAYKTLSGPGTIVARVDSLEETHPWAKAGVMIRETLDADSKYAFAVLSAASGVATQNRTDTGISATGVTEADISAPHWVKLERDAGGFFTVSHSTDGSSWNPVAGTIANNIPMASDVYIGLAVTSHDASAVTEAKFSNVTMTGNVGAQWMNQDIGIQANAAEPFYVSLSNADGTIGVVTNEDAKAAVSVEWTEWPIELSRFADQGVNLSEVDELAIGLGATGDPGAAGGSGTMFIDDIVLLRSAPAPQP